MILCPKCSFKSGETTTCPKCGLIYEKYMSRLARDTELTSSSGIKEESPYKEPTLDGRLIPFDSFNLNVFSLPAAFTFAFFCHYFDFLYVICHYFFSIPIHELGHAVLSWLCSRWAIPISVFIPMAAFTTLSPSSSLPLFLIFVGLLGYVMYLGIQRNRKFLVAWAGILICALIYCTFILSPQNQYCLQVFGGIFGEFAISTVFIAGFYYRISNRFRWDFVRFLFLIPGSFTFLNAYSDWLKISHFKIGLPSGSFLNGSGDSNGDIDRLLHDFGWNVVQVIHTYLNTAKICLCIIILHYLTFAYLAFQSKSKNSR